MKKPTEDRRVRKTKKALRQGFAKLLNQKPAKDITVRELSDLVDLHRGTFYLHYKDIFDLQAQIEDELIQEFHDALDHSCDIGIGNDITKHFLAVLEYIKENADMAKALLNNNGDLSFFQRICDLAREHCLNDFEELYPNSTSELYEYCGHYAVNGSIGVVRHWLNTGMELSCEQVAQMIGRMVLDGVGVLKSDMQQRKK